MKFTCMLILISVIKANGNDYGFRRMQMQVPYSNSTIDTKLQYRNIGSNPSNTRVAPQPEFRHWPYQNGGLRLHVLTPRPWQLNENQRLAHIRRISFQRQTFRRRFPPIPPNLVSAEGVTRNYRRQNAPGQEFHTEAVERYNKRFNPPTTVRYFGNEPKGDNHFSDSDSQDVQEMTKVEAPQWTAEPKSTADRESEEPWRIKTSEESLLSVTQNSTLTHHESLHSTNTTTITSSRWLAKQNALNQRETVESKGTTTPVETPKWSLKRKALNRVQQPRHFVVDVTTMSNYDRNLSSFGDNVTFKGTIGVMNDTSTSSFIGIVEVVSPSSSAEPIGTSGSVTELGNVHFVENSTVTPTEEQSEISIKEGPLLEGKFEPFNWTTINYNESESNFNESYLRNHNTTLLQDGLSLASFTYYMGQTYLIILTTCVISIVIGNCIFLYVFLTRKRTIRKRRRLRLVTSSSAEMY